MSTISLEPLLPLSIIGLLLVVPASFIAFGVCMRRAGAILRSLTLLAFATALLGPVIVWQEREPTQATIALIVDRSLSQKMGQRLEQTDVALTQLKTVLAQLLQFDVRIVEVSNEAGEDEQQATHLFSALTRIFADVQPARQGGVIMITDGQIHDTPNSMETIGITAPINALITGYDGEFDRQIRLEKVPRFGLVGQSVILSFRIEDLGKNFSSQSVTNVTLLINGVESAIKEVQIGATSRFEFDLPLAGNNIIELRTPVVTDASGQDELTVTNNHVEAIIEGVRENLKTLLVSGEPHSGLRIWRDLLKSDAGVDLIHFTILRPPEKFDNTPAHELSLISFPTTELFVDKIDDFDLIILDRYQHYDILPLIYYDFIAEYVKKGGALLVATGPEYADRGVSLANTPLIAALPALPTGELIEKPFLPQLTDVGRKHPVTRDLDGAHNQPPIWGRWLRQIDVDKVDDDTRILLKGADDRPLLLLGEKGEGRVGMLLSDQGWLWARGFEGGGPYADLYRRVSYWLLKQPELEEEVLNATTQAGHITIERQTMLDDEIDEGEEMKLASGEENSLTMAQITLPSGEVVEQKLTRTAPGLLTGSFTSNERGLFRIANGDKISFVLNGHLDAPEFDEVISTGDKIEPLVHSSGGNVLRLNAGDSENMQMPAIQIAKAGNRTFSDRIILRESTDSRLLQTKTLPLYSSFLALAVSLLLLGAVWQREGR